MLVQINPAVTEENAAIQLHSSDNVAIARVTLGEDQRVVCAAHSVEALEPIGAGHKIALESIPAGAPVIRYGEIIGVATSPIRAGEHVHLHNLAFQESEHETPIYSPRPATHKESTRSFLGYQRADGRVGTRNYIAVVAASNCAAHTVELVARSFEGEAKPPNVDGVVAFPHGDGCAATIGPDTEQLQRTLEGVLDHPNVAAALIIGLGCEVNQIDHYLGKRPREAASLVGMTVQESGGTLSTVEQAHNEIARLLQQASAMQRTKVPASKLTVGLNCGGSDSFSGITANPALGYCSDLIVEQGGTVVLAETPEIFGAEHLLLRRARNELVRERLLACIQSYKTYLRQFGGNFNDNPSPGNKAGGLTNIVEKSLGAVAKAGTTTLEDVVDFAERVQTPGFVFMNTPGYDPVSLTGLAAGGVNVIAFTTGRGSAIGFPNIPVLKISSNSDTFRRMPGNMDVDAGPIAEGGATVEDVGREIFEALLRIASGEKSKAEILGHREFVPWRVGPVL